MEKIINLIEKWINLAKVQQNDIKINKLIFETGYILHKPLEETYKLINYSYEDIRKIGYYNFHSQIIDNFYKVFSYIESLSLSSSQNEAKIFNARNLEFINHFLELRKYWIHPTSVKSSSLIPKTKKKLIAVRPSYNKGNMVSLNKILVGFSELLINGKVKNTYGEYETPFIVYKALEEIEEFLKEFIEAHEKIFSICNAVQ